MRIYRLLTVLATAASLAAGCTPKSEMDIFIDDLMSKMTLEEKLGQMNLPSCPSQIVTGNEKCENILENIRAGKVGAILNTYGYENILPYQKAAVEESRLGIPLLTGLDVIHGHKTVFPIPLGLAATWNPSAIEVAARLAAYEATADGLNWTYNPMVDISRDPRWGRCSEGAGEDPYLAGEVAKALVRGYQGTPEELYEGNERMLACLKHFALYGGVANGLDYMQVDMSPACMYNEYLPQYKAAIDAGVGSVMTSFNDLNGMPSTGNKWLLTELLRNQWGFEGFVVSDYNAVGELTRHGVAADKADAAAIAYNAGLDMDMVTAGCLELDKALEEGKITMKQIDNACRNILEAKYKLGLFKDPYKHLDPNLAQERIYTDESRAAARGVAAESFVLLKNDGVLPLAKKGTIAVVGPLADAGEQYPGTWTGAAYTDYPSLLDEMKKIEGIKVLHARGSNILEDADLEKKVSYRYDYKRDNRPAAQLINEAVAVARKADVVVAFVGEAGYMSGESVSRTSLDIPECQKDLLAALAKTGKPVVMVLNTGRPLTLAWEDKNMDAILNTWCGGSEAGAAIADVLFGDVNPSGKITMTFPYSLGQVPIYYNHKVSPRPTKSKTFKRYSTNWLDCQEAPLYPFGYGLSYTTFEYSAPVLSDTLMTGRTPVKASVEVKNTGSYDGYEVVQLYIRDILTPNWTRPVKELKGFQKVFIPAGESTVVEFEITPEMLSWYAVDQFNMSGSGKPLNAELVLEAGDFNIMTGPNSRDTKSVKLTVK